MGRDIQASPGLGVLQRHGGDPTTGKRVGVIGHYLFNIDNRSLVLEKPSKTSQGVIAIDLSLFCPRLPTPIVILLENHSNKNDLLFWPFLVNPEFSRTFLVDPNLPKQLPIYYVI